jgi:coenzyme PQQ precursor peptide PqqA
VAWPTRTWHDRDGPGAPPSGWRFPVHLLEDCIMRQWHTPQVVEIALGLEINCYMCAEL